MTYQDITTLIAGCRDCFFWNIAGHHTCLLNFMVIYKDQVKPKSLDSRFRGHDESLWHKRHSRENGARSEALALSRNSHNGKQLGLSG